MKDIANYIGFRLIENSMMAAGKNNTTLCTEKKNSPIIINYTNQSSE